MLKLLIRRRHMTTVMAAKQTHQWPFVDRPGLSKSIVDRMVSKSPSVNWILGGKGCGKTEMIYRCSERMLKSSRQQGSLVITVDFEDGFADVDVKDIGAVAKRVEGILMKQICSQVSPVKLFHALSEVIPSFDTKFRESVISKPLWAHYARSISSVDELWAKIITSSSVATAALSNIHFADDHIDSLQITVHLIALLGSSNVSLNLLHVEKIANGSIFKDPLLQTLLCSSFNTVIECNDTLKSIWSICDADTSLTQSITEVEDLPKEAVKRIFCPSLLSDETQVDVLFDICGGRPAALEKLIVPLNILNEEQKIENMKQEQKYKSGKENRPSAESKELQLDPLIHKKDVLIRDLLVDGALAESSDQFMETMDNLAETSESLKELKRNASKTDFQVLLGESARNISACIRKNGYLAIPSNLSPLDIAHPVVLALLQTNILTVKWLPYPRIVVGDPLNLFMLETWTASKDESMNMCERIQYNAVLLKNRKHLIRQLEKLSR